MSASERVLARRDSQRDEQQAGRDKSAERAQVSSKQLLARKPQDVGRGNMKTSVGGRPKDSTEPKTKNLADIKRRQVIYFLCRIKRF